MGKKGSWLSALKRVFAPNSKEKPVHGADKKNSRDKKKWGIGKLKHGESSFIPLHREPSSVEKILGDAERENQILQDHLRPRDRQRPPSLTSRDLQNRGDPPSRREERPHPTPRPPPLPPPPLPPPKTHHQKPAARFTPRPSPNLPHIAATKIQTAYRGYTARRSYRALKGLVRLQGVMRGQNVKRQTMNAMKCMQMLVRVQSQIHSRRIQMMESQAAQRQSQTKSDKEQESPFGRWALTPQSQRDDHGEWDDSMLTKEEIEARVQRKVEAVMKRERQLAYAYSHQLWKATPKSAQAALAELRAGGYPWWWNWVERQMPKPPPEDRLRPRDGTTPTPTPTPPLPRPTATPTRTPIHPRPVKPLPPAADAADASTPVSLRSSPAPRFKILKATKPGGEFSPRTPLRDDESLTSCPPFSVPNYMTPTMSAKAKVRTPSNLTDRSAAATPRAEPKKRMSFALGQSIGSIRWGKGSFFSGTETPPMTPAGGGHAAMHSVGNLSVDSTLSLPAAVGANRPFRFK